MSRDREALVGMAGLEPLLTIAEAADLLGLSPRSVMRLIKDGKLRVVRIGRAVRIRPEHLKDLVESS
jgi:excisionase family DNA binding protein